MKIFVGLDLSLEKTAVCVEDDAGAVIWEKKVRSAEPDLNGHSRKAQNTGGRGQ